MVWKKREEEPGNPPSNCLLVHQEGGDNDFRMASKKAASKGKRYSPEEKQKIVDFVVSHNAEKGRGGATAASKQFGVSQLTVGAWLKSSAAESSPAKAKATRAGSNGSAGTRGKVLAELSKLDGVIAEKRKELDALEARFQKLKAGL